MELPINHLPFMNRSNPLQTLLQSKGPWMGDGPMGTELLRMGWSLPSHGPTHHWNATLPDLVRAVHQQWAASGAQIHRTNTFTLLPDFTKDPRGAAECLDRAITLARQADPRGAVVAAFGPVSPDQDPPPKPPTDLISAILSRADGILLESWSHPHVLDWARWLGGNRGQPLIISGCFRRFPQGKLATLGGIIPSDWVHLAREAKALAVGYNCGFELLCEDFMALHFEFRKAWPGPLWCFPGPIDPQGESPLFEQGMDRSRTVMGGCCGVDLATFRQRISLDSLE